MEKTSKVLNQLVKEGLVERYAIGGAFASIFYMEPVLTYDVDVFVFLPKGQGKLVLLSPIYDYLKKKGYREKKEHIVIEGIPVQFIPAYNALVEEAVRGARERYYKGVKIKVLRAEHLAAVMLQTGRPKDKMRLALFLQQANMNRKVLAKILDHHGLKEKWTEFQRVMS